MLESNHTTHILFRCSQSRQKILTLKFDDSDNLSMKNQAIGLKK